MREQMIAATITSARAASWRPWRCAPLSEVRAADEAHTAAWGCGWAGYPWTDADMASTVERAATGVAAVVQFGRFVPTADGDTFRPGLLVYFPATVRAVPALPEEEVQS